MYNDYVIFYYANNLIKRGTKFNVLGGQNPPESNVRGTIFPSIVNIVLGTQNPPVNNIQGTIFPSEYRTGDIPH